MKTSTHLRKARALVNKGWCKGTYDTIIDGQKCYCMSGALIAVTGAKEYLPAKQYLATFTKKYHGPEYNLPLIQFNDHPHTKKKDVLAVFDLAIKKAVEDETR